MNDSDDRALPPSGTSGRDLALSLAILRIIREYSQSELAEAAGVTNSAISDYERAKVDPQTQTLQKLIRALNLPLSALDDTQAFVLRIRAQMHAKTEALAGEADDAFSAASAVSPAKRAQRLEIAIIASEAGRFASRFVHFVLDLLAQGRDPL
jgi:transcriptional regulator with XRE-family HTH domain